MRGRKPKPIALHVAEGTYRPHRHGPVAGVLPQAPGEIPERPESLKGEASKFWDRIVGELAKLGIASEIDVPLLESLCEVYALYRAALKEVKRNPMSKEARVAYTAYFDRFEKGLGECGLTPVARARLKVDTTPERKGVAVRERGVS